MLSKKNYDFDLRGAKKELRCIKLEKIGFREIWNPKPELNERDLAIGLMYGVYKGYFNKNEFGLTRYKLKRSKDYAVFVSPIFDLLYDVTEAIKDIHGTDVTDIWTKFVDECLEFAEDDKITNLKSKVRTFFVMHPEMMYVLKNHANLMLTAQKAVVRAGNPKKLEIMLLQNIVDAKNVKSLAKIASDQSWDHGTEILNKYSKP